MKFNRKGVLSLVGAACLVIAGLVTHNPALIATGVSTATEAVQTAQ